MKLLRASILEVVYAALDELNQDRSPNQWIEKSESTVLFGANSILDSLSFVSLIVSVEQRLKEKSDLPADLTNARAMSRNQSPFRTVQTLVDYIVDSQKELST